MHHLLTRVVIFSIGLGCAAGGQIWAADSTSKSGKTNELSQSKEIGSVYKSWASPQQQDGEESDTPATAPAEFKSTTPSIPREQRKDSGYGTLSFTKDLSRAYVVMKIKNIDVSKINLFHIHCGAPGILGPVLIDFGLKGDLTKLLATGEMRVELKNQDLIDEINTGHHHGLTAALVGGCQNPEDPASRVNTIAGMEQLARHGQLYLNLHTTGQSYYGDIRGQLYLDK